MEEADIADRRNLLLSEVTEACSGENNRPCADMVTVEIGKSFDGAAGNVFRYGLEITPHLLPGASQEVLKQVEEKAKAAVKELYSFGRDITKNIIAGMCYVQGITGLDITITDLSVHVGYEITHSVNLKNEAAYCLESDIVINQPVIDGGLTDV